MCLLFDCGLFIYKIFNNVFLAQFVVIVSFFSAITKHLPNSFDCFLSYFFDISNCCLKVKSDNFLYDK